MQALFLLAVLLHAARALQWHAGVASRSLVPPIDGKRDYFLPIPPPTDETTVGVPVDGFDHGIVGIGNGARSAKYVRDDVRAQVLLLRRGHKDDVFVIVTSNVYMYMKPDLQKFYEAPVTELLHECLGEDVTPRFLVSASHNHHGPETSMGVNRSYLRDHFKQLVDATREACSQMQAVSLSVGSVLHYFGQGDKRDPHVLDPKLTVMELKPVSPRTETPLAVLAQWSMHPEVTLGARLPCPPPEGDDCVTRNAHITGDFVGDFERSCLRLTGAQECLFVNGAIGNLIVPWGVIWDSEKPGCEGLGDGRTPPAGCEDLPRNFRRSYLIGNELALAVRDVLTGHAMDPLRPRVGLVPMRSLKGAKTSFRRVYTSVYMNNALFQVGMAKLPRTQRPLGIGHELRELYTCADQHRLLPEPVVIPEHLTSHEQVAAYLKEHFDPHCESDGFESKSDPEFNQLPRRTGRFALFEMALFDIDTGKSQLRWLTMPAEIAPELVAGLPQDFDTADDNKYYRKPERHIKGKDYVIPGVARQIIGCGAATQCITSGLTNDELGYATPQSDYRIKCTQDEETCARMHLMGIMEFEQEASAKDCMPLYYNEKEHMTALTKRYGAEAADWLWHTCSYGTRDYLASHYNENMQASIEAADALISAVAVLAETRPLGRFRDTVDYPDAPLVRPPVREGSTSVDDESHQCRMVPPLSQMQHRVRLARLLR